MADFVGVSDVYVWKVIKDDDTAYETGEIESLSRTGELSQTTEQAQNVVYYSNIAAYAVNSRGATTISAVVEALALQALAKIYGTTLDDTTGALIDDGIAKDIALGVSFRADYVGEEGARYYSYPKVTISIPDENTKTKDAGTDTLNQSLTITAVSTKYKFASTGKHCKVVIADTENSGTKLNLDKWFEQPITPDSLADIRISA